MFGKLQERAERIGARAVARAKRRIVAELDGRDEDGELVVRGERWVGRLLK